MEIYVPTKEEIENAEGAMSETELALTKIRVGMIEGLRKLGKMGYIEKYRYTESEERGYGYMKTTDHIEIDVLEGTIDNHKIHAGKTVHEEKNYHNFFVLDNEELESGNEKEELLRNFFGKYKDLAIDREVFRRLIQQNNLEKEKYRSDNLYKTAKKLLE